MSIMRSSRCRYVPRSVRTFGAARSTITTPFPIAASSKPDSAKITITSYTEVENTRPVC